MGDENYRYWAFISYSSRDAGTAVRLHRKLESYRIPRSLVGRPGRDGPIPKKLFPIFRDRDELPLSADLGATIQDALRASRYLIVLCSPRSAESRWVNEEIRYFKSLGREDRILAIIVDGEPNASDNPATAGQECFAPALRHHVSPAGELTEQRTEPIAGDLRKTGDGWQNAFLKAVAGITGLGFDAFAKREAKRRVRRRLVMACAGMVLLAGAIAFWDYRRVKVRYYAAFTERWEVPEGVIRLADDVRQRRGKSYRVLSRGYKVRTLEIVNSAGRLISDENDEFARIELDYREDGSLERRRDFNRNGVLIAQRVVSLVNLPDATGRRQATVRIENVAGFAKALDDATTSLVAGAAARRTSISGFIVTYDPRGFTEHISFRNAMGAPMRNIEGAFGQKFLTDERGLVLRTTNTSLDGQPAPDRLGVVTVAAERDAMASLAKVRALDSSDRPVSTASFHAAIEYQSDAAGNRTRLVYLDTDGKPTFTRDGYATAEIKYDDRGYRVEERSFDPAGQPVIGQHGVACIIMRPDGQGNYVELDFRGVDGRPILSAEGVARIQQTFDHRGNVLEKRFFDESGRPVVGRIGTAGERMIYDQRGREIEKCCFGVDGEPVISREGFAFVRRSFDDHDNLISVSHFGVNGEPISTREGLASIRSRYDERGNHIEVAVFAPDGQPVVISEGFATMQFSYDEHGNTTEIRVLGSRGEPAMHRFGWSKLSRVYDARGNNTVETYHGVDGRPSPNRGGYAVMNRKFDDRGNEIATAHLDRDGKPTASVEGIARMIRTFDARGKETSIKFFGPDDQPALHRDGFSSSQSLYDARGNLIDIRYFGIDGKPAQHREGYARQSQEFDQRGNPLKVMYYGIDGKLSLLPGGYAGATVQYDARGLRTSATYLGTDGMPVNSPMGFATQIWEWDDRRNERSVSYVDKEGKSAMSTYGARLEYTRDSRGNTAEVRSFDLSGRPCLSAQGFHLVRSQYDARDNLIERSFFGTDGKPVTITDGFARRTQKFDSMDRLIEQAYFALDGSPAVGLSGKYVRAVHTYDERGQIVKYVGITPDGQEVPLPPPR